MRSALEENSPFLRRIRMRDGIGEADAMPLKNVEAARHA